MLLTGTVLASPTEVIEEGAVLVKGDEIARVGPRDDLVDAYPDQEKQAYDIISPGVVQTHVHSVQSPGRGLADDTGLFEWLYDNILPIEANFEPEELKLASEISYYELIESGTTTVIDHLTVNHSEKAFEAAKEIGIRGAIGKVLMDRDSPEGLLEDTDKGLKRSRELIEKYHRANDDRIRYSITPRFTPTCSEECLRGVRELADDYEDVIIHTHASEADSVVENSYEERGMGDIEWLHEVGLTGEDVVYAHVIVTSEEEREILAETGTHIAYCPASNMKTGAGIAPIPDYLDRGINVSLGNDGAPANNVLDPFSEMHFATLLQKVEKNDPETLPAERVFEMATVNGAQAAGFEKVGKLREGWKADIIGINLKEFRTIPFHDPYSHLVYAANGSDVAFTMVDGEVLMEQNEIVVGDPEETFEKGRDIFEQLSN
jgi:cytosine/adenosine deaminase-related metal-dependent hydrolase